MADTAAPADADAASSSPDSTSKQQACGFTVFRTTKDTCATKRWHWTGHEWRKVSYSAGARFDAQEVTFSTIDDLAAILERVRRDPRAFVVRGALTEYARTEIAKARRERKPAAIRRRKHDREDAPATLAEVDRRWLMGDIDNFPLPPWADLAEDPGLVVEHAVRELFPPAFHDVRAYWQLSASAGFVAGVLKAHVFFVLAEHASNAAIKASLAEHAPGVDLAPFQAAQPHFVADPIIEGGHDPLPARTGWLDGTEDVVLLPPVTARQAGERPRPTTGSLPPGDMLAALALLGHGEGRRGFHEPLRAATLRYARQCVRFGERDDDLLKAQLQDAIRAAPVRPGTRDSELEPYLSDAYLQAFIDGAFRLVRTGDADLAGVSPHHQGATGDAGSVRAELRTLMADAFARARGFYTGAEPDHDLLAVGVGLGKTRSARELLVEHVAIARAERRRHRVLYLVPHHKLSNEILADMRQDGLDAAVWRGRDAVDPDAGGDARMCRNLERVADAVSVSADVELTVCGKPGDPFACPFRGTCAYQAQKGVVQQADVVIASNTLLFRTAPKATLDDDTGLVIVDEGWWDQGIIHTTTAIDAIPAGLRADPVLTYGKRQAPLEVETYDLEVWCDRLADAVRPLPVGALVDRTTVRESGLTAADCREARKLEWARKRNVTLHPGLTRDAWKEAVRQLAVNATLGRRAGIWTAVEALLDGEDEHTGRLEIGENKDGDPVLLVHGRADVRSEVAGRPMLLLDATAPVDIVRRYLPRVRLLGDLHAKAPHLRVNQVLGGWGKTSLLTSPKATPEENRRRDGMLEALADFVRLHGQGNAAVITYERAEGRFAGLPGVVHGHFGAITGINALADVDHLFVIGRPLADPRDQLAQARALTGRPIAPETPHQTTRGVLMADGKGMAINVRAYHDPDLEAVRAAVTDAEIVQAVGRGRGVNRDADKPLTVWLLADVVTPLPVDNLVRWEDVRLSPMARMLARGTVLLSPRDAAIVYPWLFPSEEAARKAIVRERDFPDIPLWVSSYREMSGKYLPEVRYRPVGRGQQTRRALVLPSHLIGCRDWLEEQFGELALFEIVGQPPAPEPQPPTPPPEHAPMTDTAPEAPEAALLDPGCLFPLAGPRVWSAPDLAFAVRTREGGVRHLAVLADGREVRLEPRRRPAPPGTAPADMSAEDVEATTATLDPDAVLPRAEVPSRSDADLQLRVRTADGQSVPIRPRLPSDVPAEASGWKARSMWDQTR